MTESKVGGYARKFLRIDLPSERLSNAVFDEETLRRYIGGIGIGIMPYREELLENYYTPMGCDVVTSKPLPETLRRLDLGYIINDIW